MKSPQLYDYKEDQSANEVFVRKICYYTGRRRQCCGGEYDGHGDTCHSSRIVGRRYTSSGRSTFQLCIARLIVVACCFTVAATITSTTNAFSTNIYAVTSTPPKGYHNYPTNTITTASSNDMTRQQRIINSLSLLIHTHSVSLKARISKYDGDNQESEDVRTEQQQISTPPESTQRQPSQRRQDRQSSMIPTKSTKPKQSRFAQPQFQKISKDKPSGAASSISKSATAATTITSSSTIPTVSNSYVQPRSASINTNPPRPSLPNKTTQSTPNAMIDRDRMWKRPTITSSKSGHETSSISIEDLEQRLMQRYGTDMTKWTSGEFDDDDDDDDMEYEQEEEDEHDNDRSTSTTANTFARSPSVFDPWEDLPQLSASVSTSSHRRPVSDDNTISEALLENQPLPPAQTQMREQPASAFKASSSLSGTATISPKPKSSPLSAFGRRTDSVSVVAGTQKPTIDLSHLITKEPAGGRGTNAIQQPPTSNMSGGSRTVNTSNAVSSILDEENASKQSTILRSSTQPILDSSGVPMLLTIAQAQLLFEQQLERNNVPTITNAETSPMNAVDDEAEIQSTSTWYDLGITNPVLVNNLNRINCEFPLPAQRTSCPSIVSGTTDVIIGTYTGSGKTLAFLIPIIQRIMQMKQDDNSVFDQKSGYVKLMIVAPGRELASQIATVTRTLLADVDLSCMLAIGGTTFTRNLEQIRKRKPDILIGTPGRLAELIIGTSGSDIGGTNMKRGGRVPINNVQAIVLDEFDALLSYPPHSDPVNALMEYIKRNRGDNVQTVMCSATASDMMIQQKKGELLEQKYLRPGYVFAVADADDILVTALNSDADVNRNVTRTTRVSRTVMHGVVHVPHKRFALYTLRRILHTEPIPQQILIFVSDSRKVGIVVEKLADVGIIAAPLHGGMDSEKMDRAEVSRALREGYVGIVVSTEMAARGLDAPLLTHVINMDLPTDSSHYAHRAGRCGRGGRPGVVINLTTSPQERGVPIKLADQLGVKMYTVEVKNAKLNVIDPKSQILDGS